MYIIVSGTVRAVGGTTMTLQEMRQEEYAKTIKIAGKGAGRHFSTIGNLPGQKRSLPAGVSFGEGALLMPGAVADSTYRAASSGCTLLEVPRTYFYQMIGKDLTLVSALHIKLLRDDASLKAVLTHPRTRAAFAGFLQIICGDENSLDAYEQVSSFSCCLAALLPLLPYPIALLPSDPLLDTRDQMHAYAELIPAGLNAAARTIGQTILSTFLVDTCARPIDISVQARQQLVQMLPRNMSEPWPTDLFAGAEEELNYKIRYEYLPLFMQHPVFDSVQKLLGTYDADALFPADHLEETRRNLHKVMEGDLSLTAAAEHSGYGASHAA